MCWGAFSCYTVAASKTGYLELGYSAQEARSRQAPGIPEYTLIPLLVQAKPFQVRGLEVAGVLTVPSPLHLLDVGGGVPRSQWALVPGICKVVECPVKCLPTAPSKREQLVLGGRLK